MRTTEQGREGREEREAGKGARREQRVGQAEGGLGELVIGGGGEGWEGV